MSDRKQKCKPRFHKVTLFIVKHVDMLAIDESWRRAYIHTIHYANEQFDKQMLISRRDNFYCNVALYMYGGDFCSLFNVLLAINN